MESSSQSLRVTQSQSEGCEIQVSGFVLLSRVDRRHSADLAILINPAVLCPILSAFCALASADEYPKRVRSVTVRSFPLAWLKNKTLRDDEVVLEKVFARDVWVTDGARRLTRGRMRVRCQPDDDHIDGCGARVDAAVRRLLGSVMPNQPPVSSQNSATRRLRRQCPAF